MRFGKEAGNRRGDDPAHRLLSHFDDVDRIAARERDGGEFETDKPGADYDNCTRLLQPLPQRISIRKGAQRQHAVELGSGHGKRPAPGAGGEHQMVPRELGARSQMEAVPPPIDCRHSVTVDEVDLLLGVELRRPQP